MPSEMCIRDSTLTDQMTCRTNNADIVFEPLDVGGAIHLEAKNGDITGTVVGGYDDFSITTQVKKGETNLPKSKPEGEKSLDVSVNNGDAQIRFEKAQ